MKKLVSAIALVALGIMPLASTPSAHAAADIVGVATWAAGVAVVEIGGNTNAGGGGTEYHTLLPGTVSCDAVGNPTITVQAYSGIDIVGVSSTITLTAAPFLSAGNWSVAGNFSSVTGVATAACAGAAVMAKLD